VGFVWPRVRVRALRALVFLASLTRKTGRCAPPPALAAPLLLIRPPKIFTIYRTWAAHVKSFHWTTEAMNMRSPAPAPPIAASLIFPAIFLRSNYVPMRTYALIFSVFSVFSIFFGSFLFVNFFFFFSPFQFLLILLFLSFSSYLFLFFS
jgi:hypothetical protein